MRDIKFRGMTGAKEFVYGDMVRDDNFTYIVNISFLPALTLSVDYFVEVDPETVGQYTGIKDKHGNKIFEGDIDTHGRVVKWREGRFDLVQDNGQTYDYLTHMTHIEIIGNIHQDKHLLK